MLTELENKHAAIRKIAQSTGTPVVDVQAAFSSLRGRERSAFFYDEMHLTPRGNEKVAELISNLLIHLMLDRRTSMVLRIAARPINTSTHSQ